MIVTPKFSTTSYGLVAYKNYHSPIAHHELSSAESELPHLSKSNIVETQLSTASGIQILKDKFEDEGNDKLKRAAWYGGSIKKKAKARGRSPSSLVRTSYSTSTPKLPNQGPSKSARAINSLRPRGAEARLDDSKLGLQNLGKRLFEPDLDPPFGSSRPTSLNSPGARISVQQRGHRKRQRSEQSGDQVHSREPGVVPAAILASVTANAHEIPPPESPKIVCQPETRPISREQLAAEVKGIYAGLVMVEAKFIQVDARQAAHARNAPLGTQSKLNNKQWQALIALHRTFLHEHHDFFLASQYPSATPAVRRLAI